MPAMLRCRLLSENLVVIYRQTLLNLLSIRELVNEAKPPEAEENRNEVPDTESDGEKVLDLAGVGRSELRELHGSLQNHSKTCRHME